MVFIHLLYMEWCCHYDSENLEMPSFSFFSPSFCFQFLGSCAGTVLFGMWQLTHSALIFKDDLHILKNENTVMKILTDP